MEHLIWSLGVFLTGTWVCLSMKDLLIGFKIRLDFRIGIWMEDEHVTAIDLVHQEEEAEERRTLLMMMGLWFC